MKAFVTGGTGFTGGHLVKRLVKDGHDVTALARPVSNTEKLEKLGVNIVRGDIKDRDVIFEATKGADYVFNIAAAFREANLSEEDFYDVNYRSVKHKLEACEKHKVKKFIHCSTIGVVSSVSNPPADETTPACPGDAYQASKYAAEREVLKQSEERSIPATVIRPCAIYGPGDLRMLKLFKMISKKRFVFFGQGKVHLHTVFIDNLIDGFMLAAQKEEANGHVFIIGDEGYVTLKKLAAMVAKELGVSEPNIHLPYRPAEEMAKLVEYSYRKLKIKKEPPIYKRRIAFFKNNRAFSIEKAKTILGYHPKVDLETGISQTEKWYIKKGFIAKCVSFLPAMDFLLFTLPCLSCEIAAI